MEQVRDLNMEADDMQAAVWWRTFPNGQGGARASVYQSTHLTGLSGQKDYFLYAVRREDTI